MARYVPGMPGGWVYILTNHSNAVLYVGVTNDIARRAWEHRTGVGSQFVKRYGVTKLVCLEHHADILRAIQREKIIKHWPRRWKLDLIATINPGWEDLYDRLNRSRPIVVAGCLSPDLIRG